MFAGESSLSNNRRKRGFLGDLTFIIMFTANHTNSRFISQHSKHKFADMTLNSGKSEMGYILYGGSLERSDDRVLIREGLMAPPRFDTPHPISLPCSGKAFNLINSKSLLSFIFKENSITKHTHTLTHRSVEDRQSVGGDKTAYLA